MNRTLAIIGVVCGLMVLVGFSTPWLELNSAPYQLEGATVKDNLKITGWNLVLGKVQVVQRKLSSEEPSKIIEIKVESKSYPYLDLVGGILLALGGVSALLPKRKLPYAIIILGGSFSFVGGCLGLLDNRWIRHPIIIGDYTVFGYYSHGLLICITGSLLSIIACSLTWGLKR